MLSITLSSVACLSLPFFSPLIHDMIKKKKDIAHKMSLQVFSTNFVRRVCIYIYIYKILRRIQQDIIINVRRCSCEVSVIFVRF